MKLRSLCLCLLSLCLVLILCPGCEERTEPAVTPAAASAPPLPTAPPATPEPTEAPRADFHTLRLAADALPSCWNVHTWETETDSFLWSLTASPLVDIGLSADGRETVWVYQMAESVEDVTASWYDAWRWGISPDETGRVWRIRLNPLACWDDEAHTPITADSYLYSMRQCLSPEMDNYRAGYFCDGAAALLGARAYRRSGADIWEENALGSGDFTYPAEGWTYDEEGYCRAPDGTVLYFSLQQPLSVWLDGSSLEDYYRAGYVPEDTYSGLLRMADEDGFVPVTRRSSELLYSFTGSDAWGRETTADLAYYTAFRRTWPTVGWDSVGLLKEDDHTLIYICAESVDEFDFLFGLTTPWLVYEPLYEGGRFEYGGRSYTSYGTGPDTTVSCGPYRLSDMTDGSLTLERNESWIGYRDGSGDGFYETDRIVLEAAGRSEARRLFAGGDLDLLIPGEGESLPEGAEASVLYRDDAYTYRFFMVTDKAALARLQASSGEGETVNKTCLANEAFREALSWALDRVRFAEAAGEAFRPALGLIGRLYCSGVESDLNSRYRDTVPAMTALCSAYGVNLSGVTNAEELRAAAEACTGYEPGRARRLFQTACDQMAEDGSWTEGMVVRLRCAVGSGELTEAQRRQNELLQQLLEEAAAGTDLQGKLFIEFCTLDNRYAAVAAGEIEMGYGAWGGAAFDPYGLMQCYCDPSFNTVQESCGFDPTSRLLTLMPDPGDEPITATYTEWCRSILPGGAFAGNEELRLNVLAGLESALLKERRFIVTSVGTQPVWLSAKVMPGSEDYSILSGFGGIRSLHYRYDDAEWAARG
ncbi:MAG: hypothetical protein IKD79_02255 [Oscillospiraceae bacterium]|nr:hypothetical protein [Oscillospiraceae bacterium]